MKKVKIGEKAPDFSLLNTSRENINLSHFKNKSLIIVFTRYVGCPVCQVDTAQYAKDYSLVKEASMELLVVFQSEVSVLADFKEKELLPYVALSDVARSSYEAYGVESGIKGFLSSKNISPLINSFKAGKRHGRFEGNEFQYPAVFALDEEHRIIFSHYGEYIADSLKIPDVIRNLPEKGP